MSPAGPKPTTPRVFITHSSLDQELAASVVRSLRLATGLPTKRIFCSSLDGMGIPTGEVFVEYIHKQLAATELVVPLITPAYLDSQFCMWELGAAWVRGVALHPIAVDAVAWDDLPILLSALQVDRLNKTGLNRLAPKVARATGTKLDRTAWEQERDDVLGSLPATVERLQPAWRATPAAVQRRKARVAAATSDVHVAMHTLRDASVIAIAAGGGAPNRDAFLAHLRSAAQAMARAFAASSGHECRVTIKQLIIPDSDDDLAVADLTRSTGRNSIRHDLVTENTDFENLLEGVEDWFISNDLEALRATGGYKNSHVDLGDPLPYSSTVVWPIRKLFDDIRQAEALGARTALADLLGFLCVDTTETDAFDQHEVDLGAAFADALYPVLRPHLLP